MFFNKNTMIKKTFFYSVLFHKRHWGQRYCAQLFASHGGGKKSPASNFHCGVDRGVGLGGIPVEEAEEAIFAIALNVRGQVK